MKTKLIYLCILLVLLMRGSDYAWAHDLYFANTTIECLSTETWEYTDGDYNYYQQDLLWKWEGDQNEINLTNLSNDDDFTWTVEVTGDISVPDGHYLKKSIDNKSYIIEGVDNSDGTKIYFTGKSGTIKVTATNPDYGGDTYSCSYTIYYHMDSKKWDFYTKRLAVGRVADTGSSLHKHLNDWTLYTVTNSISGESEESVYFYNSTIGTTDSPASASQLVSETDGLLFYAPAGTFGLYNENESEGICGDRFVALKKGAKFVIPQSTYNSLSNPRIRIKMGRYGGVDASNPRIDLTITNGKDALGKVINSTYGIGGSAWWGDKKDNQQRGEYHFIINDNTADFSIEVTDGQWLKLYSIEVYNSTELVTENSVLGNRYQLLNKGGTVGANGASGTYYLHYRGKGENTKVYTYNEDNTNGKNWDYWPTGTVTCKNENFSNYTGGTEHTYTSIIGEFGSFHIRLECYTITGEYCTDYASRSQSVGYLSAKSYPYTWDFTDVNSYSGGANRLGKAGENTQDYGEGDYIYFDRWDKRAAWENQNNIWGHRLSKDGSGHDVIFCGGSQLWYGKTIIPELAGLGFTPSNSSAVYNNTLQITSNGLKIDQNTRDWWCYRIAVPNVPASGALYVRVHPERSDGFYNAGYSYGDYVKPIGNSSGNEETKFGEGNSFSATDGSGDMIYVVPGNETSATDNITLYFNGVTIKKIAVSTDSKQFNAKGWTTESRDHDIDPSLTAYMTGRNIKTYLVTNIDYPNKTVELTEIGSSATTNYLMEKSEGNDNNACILRNSEDAMLNIVNNSFHLFVPDIHDEQGESLGDGYQLKNYYRDKQSKMKAQLTAGTVPMTYDGYTNFAFTYQYYDVNPTTGTSTESTPTTKNGAQAFYRINSNGANSAANKGYLPVLTNSVGANARLNLVFVEEDSQTTEITGKETGYKDNNCARYYNLKGQLLSGRPIHRGIYIQNGKKIFIK